MTPSTGSNIQEAPSKCQHCGTNSPVTVSSSRRKSNRTTLKVSTTKRWALFKRTWTSLSKLSFKGRRLGTESKATNKCSYRCSRSAFWKSPTQKAQGWTATKYCKTHFKQCSRRKREPILQSDSAGPHRTKEQHNLLSTKQQGLFWLQSPRKTR